LEKKDGKVPNIGKTERIKSPRKEDGCVVAAPNDRGGAEKKEGEMMAELNQELASRWQRLWGSLIDALIAMAIIFPAMWFLGLWQLMADAKWSSSAGYFEKQQEVLGQLTIEQRIIMFALGTVVFIVIQGYLLGKYGQTIGKRMVGTRIVSCEDGRILPFWTVFSLRYLPVSLVSQIPVAGQWLSLIDVLFIFRKDKRCIHDLIAGTKVVKVDKQDATVIASSSKQAAVNDDAFYDEVAKEIETNNLVSGVWTRAFAEADGDENRAKSIYIKLRVAKLMSDANPVSEKPVGIKRPKKKGFGFWFLIVLVAFLALVMLGELVDYHQNISSKSKSAFPSSSQENTKVDLQKSKSFISRNGPQEGRTWIAQLGGGVEMEFMPIPAGSFLMGSNGGEENERPVHRVTLSKPFWLAKTEVTQQQYKQMMGSNPSEFLGLENPVETVSWNDAVSFCKNLTESEQRAGRLPGGFEYVLPTEAQWEYACRAGTMGEYAGDVDLMAWHRLNSGRDGSDRYGKSHPVRTKKPNAWGLYDMHGNVEEWCNDRDGSYGSGSATDPQGASRSSRRLIRGGSWGTISSCARSAYRDSGPPGYTNSNLGFRVCLVQR
jgi:formylglycine-generating enzyme required for sulfatase activity/uncharacterized RDD family membrane protein YckC